MTKAELIEEKTEETADYWLKALSLSGSILFMLLTAASYFIWPGKFVDVMLYNVPAALALYGIYQLAGIRRNRLHIFTLAAIAAILSAASIELIILTSGAHTSGYYVAMIILMIAALGFIPFNIVWSLSISTAVYSIYLIPILFLDTITDTAGFIEKNIFMLSVISVAILWRETIQRKTIESLELQHDLEAKKDAVDKHRLIVDHALEVFSHVADEVEKMKNFEKYSYSPIKNYHIPTCWEVKECGETECPAFGVENERCWQIAGTHCGGEVQGKFAKKFEDCRECEIYQEATKDQILELSESFNNMMHILENTHLELKEADRAAEEEARQRYEFLNNMGHNIRIPMNNIIEMISLLSESGLTEKQGEYTADLLKNAQNILTVINDIPELSKIDNGNGHRAYH